MPVAAVPTAEQVKKNSLLDPVMPPAMAQLYPNPAIESVSNSVSRQINPDILRRQIIDPTHTEAFNPAFGLAQQRLSNLSGKANPATSPKQSPTTDEPILQQVQTDQLSSFNATDIPPTDSVLLLHYLEGILNSLPHISEVNDTFKTKCLAIQEQLLTCLLYTSPSPRDGLLSRMPSSA